MDKENPAQMFHMKLQFVLVQIRELMLEPEED